MTEFDITIITICVAGLLICWIGNYISEKCFRFKYKDQKVGVRTKWWRR